MRRVVSLFLPDWPTDRLRRQNRAAPPRDEPLVMAGQDGRRRVVLAADAAARRLGLAVGMAFADAQVLVPGIAVAEADPAGDAAGLERLALWCLRRWSPVVAPSPSDGLWIDATGVPHLFGGEAALLAQITDRLQAAGITARAAIADTPGAAHAVARHGPGRVTVVPSGGNLAALSGLPIAALRLAAGQVENLRRLGFERIGALEATPRAPLALRFGSMPGRRLDQALGRLGEPIDPIMAPEMVRADLGFAEPIGAPASLQRAVARLVQTLCDKLESRSLGARRLDLLFHRVDGSAQGIRVGTAKPVRESGRLARLLVERLEDVDPGFGVERMVLAASLAEPLGYRQAASLEASAGEADIAALVDVLSNRLGPSRLFRAVPVESDLPERSVRFVPPLAPAIGKSWPDWPRPTRLLTPPEAVEAMSELPDHPPRFFVWRGLRHLVARADGPERVFGEWWRCDEEIVAVRDYFQVEDQAGERFWLFRTGDGENPATGPFRWFLHGLFA